MRNLKHATRTSDGLALESYWSRGAILWGDAGPVRFQLSPLDPLAFPEPIPHDLLYQFKQGNSLIGYRCLLELAIDLTLL